MKKIFLITISFLGILGMNSCTDFELPEGSSGSEFPALIENWQVAESFTYNTTESISFELTIVDNAENPMEKVPFKIYSIDDQNFAELILSGRTSPQGDFNTSLNLPTITNQLVFTTTYPGISSPQIINVSSNYIKFDVNPNVPPLENDVDIIFSFTGKEETPIENRSLQAQLEYNYIGTYNGQGVPNYLMSEDDIVSQVVLDLINNNLPEGQPVPDYNPQYISEGNSSNIDVEEVADVWITFIHEGAGYRNALGYYTYPTSNPPSNVSDIDSLKIIFPNASFQGSGGGLNIGNKVHLGLFEAGTSIGWFLVPNGWNSQDTIVEEQTNKHVRFSNSNLNVFTTQSYESHTVLLADPGNELVYLGIEDLNRPSGDNDFNDAVFCLSVSPYEAINISSVPKIQSTIIDDDGDGVPNNEDDFINDPNIAFTSFVPGENTFNILSFEDFWPAKGDYDMNDMVINYNFAEYRNAENKVIKIRAKLVLKAMGAGFRNGFGFELDISPEDISSVEGHQLFESYISLADNGTESNQSKAVIIAFDNGFKIMNNDGKFVNTELEEPFVALDTVTIDITLSNPLPAGQIGAAPYNSFIMTNLRRGYEVHLPDHPPTDLANTSLFQTGDDDSNTSIGKYYKTSNNLPWAINTPTGFDYPIEKEPINSAYKFFGNWVLSSGISHPNWYKNNPGFRDNDKIYNQ